MRKYAIGLLCLGLFFQAVCVSPALGAGMEENLYESLKSKQEIRVLLPGFTQSAGESALDTGALKAAVEAALVDRKSLNFVMTDDPEEADLIIEGDVVEFFWTEQDPVDNLAGLAGIAMDAMVEESYVRAQAVFSVTDAATKEKLLERKLKATLTKADMEEQSGAGLITERLAGVFMKECFSKGKSGKKR